jgi:cell division protein FtsN
MAQRKRSNAGSAMYGVLVGLLIGFGIAAGVAFYVTRTPMPFVDHATRQAEQSKMPDLSKVDLNQPLAGGSVNPPAAEGESEGKGDARKPMDDLGALIATLPKDDDAKPVDAASAIPVPAAPPPPPPVPAAKPAVVASAAPAPAPTPAPAPGPAAANGNYYLQAGAYKQAADAESVRARILLLGMQANVQRAEVNGTQWNRVRVGPFVRLDDMNRARVRLSENKIESTVVRQ